MVSHGRQRHAKLLAAVKAAKVYRILGEPGQGTLLGQVIEMHF